MGSAELVLGARRSAGLTQRELARRSGVPQPNIARIERGLADPRLATVERLLSACEAKLRVERTPGAGVDRSQIRQLLHVTPAERLRLLRDDVAGLARLEAAARR